MFDAILVSFGSFVVMQVAWHLFTVRGHRGGHARADEMYSPYALAARVAHERSRLDGRPRDIGKHHVNARMGTVTSGLLSGELPLLSGYAGERPGSAPVMAKETDR